MAFLKDDRLDIFFSPKTVAVIGASRNPNKIGNKIFSNLLLNKTLSVYPINPNAQKILGVKAYSSVLSVYGNIDLGVIAIPAKLMEAEIKECIEKKIKNLIIISAGFSEAGEEGCKREEVIKFLAKKHDLTILGPNCLGIISSENNFNASFGSMMQKGTVTFISQSGALGTAILDWARMRNFGFANFVSLGNKTVLSENNFLLFFTKRRSPIIALYLESLSDGRRFLKISRELSHISKIVVLKGGQEKESKIAVTSHTGAMAGSFEAFRAALRQTNCIEAENLEEFFSLLEIFSSPKKITGNKIALLTNGGGPGILTLDYILRSGNKLAVLNEITKAKLKKFLPEQASITNPVDILGDADQLRYKSALEILLDDTDTDIIYILLTPQEVTDVSAIAKTIVDVSNRSQKIVIVSFIGGKKVEEGKEILRKGKVIHYPFPEQALTALKKVFRYIQKRKIKTESKISHSDRKGRKSPLILNALDENRSKLYEKEAFSLIDQYRIPHPKIFEINNADDLRKKLQSVHYPIALKLDAEKIFHRTKEKAIFLNIETIRQAQVAFERLRMMPGSVYCQEMVNPGYEIIIGAKKDPDFGHLIMFGSGGIYTEYLKDVAFAVPPIFIQDAHELIDETKIGKALKKFKPLLTKQILAISRLLINNPEISEFDVNPFIINKQGIFAVDVKVKITLMDGKAA